MTCECLSASDSGFTVAGPDGVSDAVFCAEVGTEDARSVEPDQLCSAGGAFEPANGRPEIVAERRNSGACADAGITDATESEWHTGLCRAV